MTDTWDPTNVHHKDVAHGIEVGDGIPEMRSISACRTALKNVGFEILHEEDLADRDELVLVSFSVRSSRDPAFFHSCTGTFFVLNVVRSSGSTPSKVIYAKSKLSGTSSWCGLSFSSTLSPRFFTGN